MAIDIHLLEDERVFLREFVRKGKKNARMIVRANVLLLADQGCDNEEISKLAGVHRQSIWRVKKRYLDEGLQSSLKEKSRPGQPRKYSEKHEAEIIALACSSPPKGRVRWSLSLMVETLKSRKGFETVNHENVRLILKKATRNRGVKGCGA
jgi:putative transposase